MRYIHYNANPAQKKTNDCIIRSLSLAYDKTWIEVFDELNRDFYADVVELKATFCQ